MELIHFWKEGKKLSVKCESSLPSDFIKLASLGDNVFLLDLNYVLWKGLVVGDEVRVAQTKYTGVDIGCSTSSLYLVNEFGRVFRSSPCLEEQKEIVVYEESCNCGYASTNHRVSIKKIAVGGMGCLLVSDNGELWAVGDYPQLGVHSEEPKKVGFFEGRCIVGVGSGRDFNVVISHKRDDGSVGENETEVFECPQCLNDMSPVTPQSDTAALQVKSDSVSPSTSTSKNNNEGNDTSSCSEDSNPVDTNIVSPEMEESRGMLLINTEAARQFLTKQLSWVSTGGEELLAEVSGPTRIIRMNVSSVANLVYERVKTVGDKVATLSRHVSGGSNNSDSFEEFEELNRSNASINSSFRWDWSYSDNSEEPVAERNGSCISKGSRLIRGEVWAWGSSKEGQLGVGDTVRRHKPVLVNSASHIGGIKVWCGLSHCLIQTLDGRVFGWGSNTDRQISEDSELEVISAPLLIGKALVVCTGEKHSVILTKNESLLWLATTKNKPSLDSLTNIPENLSPHRLLSCGDITCYILTDQVRTRLPSDLAHEQCFLEELLNVHNTLVKPLSRKSSLDETLSNLCCRHNDVLHLSAVIVQGLIDGKPSGEVLSGCEDDLILIYESYLNTLCDVISLNGFAQITKAVEMPLKLSACFTDRLPTRKTSIESVISCVFSEPLSHIAVYKSMVMRGGGESSRLEKLLEKVEIKKKEAELTKAFWESVGGRIPDSLRTPQRRIIKESRSSPLNLQNASRFFSHWFILLSDTFVHISGGSHNAYPLDLVWIDHSCDSEQQPQPTFTVITPEETMVLTTANQSEKNEWIHAFNGAIKAHLGKSSVPPVRTASFTFTNKVETKDATYTGRWLTGNLEGAGKLEFPDGKVYTGQFHNNLAHGYGRLVVPGTLVYEGQWREGHQNGYGITKYDNGDTYMGYYKDGNENGHGVKKTGMLSSGQASVYVGEWLLGQKHGYGVLNKLWTGEKYLGLWSGNLRNGSGLSVTLDGIYYEGSFAQDVLTGKGVIVFEDGTHYEGELKEAGVFSGKGILTFSSGDTFEGSLHGTWADGIKINGTLHKTLQSTSPRRSFSKPGSFGQLCVPADQKWKSIFRQIWSTLGAGTETKGGETARAWENIAASLNSRRGTRTHELLQKIPTYGRTELDAESYKRITSYLQLAFDTVHHPLGRAYQELVEAYTVTYGGVLVHPLLLPQAVAELRSITVRLYQVVRVLFPALPFHTSEILFGDELHEVASMDSLIHPIILPKLYSSLLILYSLHNRTENDTYWKRLLKWNRHPDSTLMAFLGVDKKFWTREDGTPVQQGMFKDAVETLQQLKTMFSPMEKLLVIHSTFKKITEAVHNELGESFVWHMDDLFPVFHYVVVRSHIQELGSEIHFIEDFIEERLKNGEMDIMFTTLKACYFQILQEKISITT